MGRKLLDTVPKNDRIVRKVKYLDVGGARKKCYMVWKLVDVQLYQIAHSTDLRKHETSSDR